LTMNGSVCVSTQTHTHTHTHTHTQIHTHTHTHTHPHTHTHTRTHAHTHTHTHARARAHTHTHTHTWHVEQYVFDLPVCSQIPMLVLQGGEDPVDALNCRSFFTKRPLIIGLFCGKWPLTIRHPMGRRHPVPTCDAHHSLSINVMRTIHYQMMWCAPFIVKWCDAHHSLSYYLTMNGAHHTIWQWMVHIPCVYVRTCTCVRAHVYMRTCARVHAYVRACVIDLSSSTSLSFRKYRHMTWTWMSA